MKLQDFRQFHKDGMNNLGRDILWNNRRSVDFVGDWCVYTEKLLKIAEKAKQVVEMVEAGICVSKPIEDLRDTLKDFEK